MVSVELHQGILFQKAPRVKRDAVFLTGCFRTVLGMVAAMWYGDTDGIGIGRLVTAEPGTATS